MMTTRSRSLPVLLALAVGALASACGGQDPTAAETDETELKVPTVAQVDEPEQRLAVTYDGGVLVLRGSDGEVLADLEMPGHLRVSPAGDDRHVMVAGPGGFTALDLGTWTADHGDHAHSWVDEPVLTELTVAAEEPGHVVSHDGWTTLFDDGTGAMTSLRTHELADLDDQAPELVERETPDPHHGVAVRTADGGWVHTVGTAEERSGVQVTDEAGEVLASSDRCPGVHGEAHARDVAVLGCEDGVLLVDGTEITKVPAPDGYGRIGNQAGSATSPYVLGDYKTDPEAELERPTRVSVVDTRDASLRLVDLGTSYTFRSLGRTPDGDGLVLGTDGALHVVDTRRAEVAGTIPVLDAWQEPTDWTEPRPALEVVGATAYVTDPASQELHVVDLDAGRVSATHQLPATPDEVVAVAG